MMNFSHPGVIERAGGSLGKGRQQGKGSDRALGIFLCWKLKPFFLF